MKKVVSIIAILTISIFVLSTNSFATDLTTLTPEQNPFATTQQQVTDTPNTSVLENNANAENNTTTEKPAENTLPEAGDASPLFFAVAVLAVIATYAYTMFRRKV